MAPKPIATLKSQMPIGVTGSISAQDIHDIVDTVEARTTGRVLAKTGNYTATADDDGATLVFTSPSTSTLTLPASLPAGWRCEVYQAGTGRVGVSVPSGTLRHASNHTFTAAQYALARLLVFANAGSAPQVAFGGETTNVNPTTGERFNVATFPATLVGVWDASAASARTPSNATLITSLATRVGPAATLTAAAVGNSEVATTLADPAYISTAGGNGKRRLDAPSGFGNNPFQGSGWLLAVVRSANPSGIIIAKWATNGWLLAGTGDGKLRFEWYQGAQSGRYDFPFPASASAWSLVEFIWDSTLANLGAFVRINGQSVAIDGTATGGATVDDTAATLTIGNRNWANELGDQNAPWNGDIGEILLFNGTNVTAEQLAPLHADLNSHWSIAEEQLPLINLSEWTLTFDEDFDTFSRRILGDASTDGNLWDTSMGGGIVRWMNDERQIYVEPEYAGTKGSALGINPFSVANSVLTITCVPVSQNDAPYLPKSYTSGLITTQGTFSQLYGYFEIRCQLPGGMGTWPAFWMLFHGTIGAEFDIFETYGVNTSTVFQTVHQPGGSSGYETATEWATGWHTYGMKWDASRIIYYIDGVPTASHINTTTTAGYLIANLALEGRSDRAPDSSTVFPLQMKIDYIRCYQPNA
jgi:hypothetical protein